MAAPSSTSQQPLFQPCMTSETFLLQVKLLPPPIFRESISCTPGWTQNVAEDDLGPPEFWGYRYALPCLGSSGLGFAHARQDLYQVGCRLHPQLFFFLMISAVCTSPVEITRYVKLFSIPLLPREPEEWERKSKPYTSTCTPSAQWPFWI